MFASLGALRTLRLDDNLFTTLPAGTFFGLAALDALGLTGNPGAPFTLTAMLEQSGESFRVRTAAGTPFEILLSYAVVGGTPSSGTICVRRRDEADWRSRAGVTATTAAAGTITARRVHLPGRRGGARRSPWGAYRPRRRPGCRPGTASSAALSDPGVGSPATRFVPAPAHLGGWVGRRQRSATTRHG